MSQDGASGVDSLRMGSTEASLAGARRESRRETAARTAQRLAGEFSADTTDEVARRLRVLGHPTRVTLLLELVAGRRNVTELAAATGLDPAAASKHLCELQRASYVLRRQEGTHAVYALAGTSSLKVLLLLARAVRADAERVQGVLRSAC